MPGVKVADVARRYGTTRWQVYDWRRKLRAEQLIVPERVAGLPMFAEVGIEDPGETTKLRDEPFCDAGRDRHCSLRHCGGRR